MTFEEIYETFIEASETDRLSMLRKYSDDPSAADIIYSASGDIPSNFWDLHRVVFNDLTMSSSVMHIDDLASSTIRNSYFIYFNAKKSDAVRIYELRITHPIVSLLVSINGPSAYIYSTYSYFNQLHRDNNFVACSAQGDCFHFRCLLEETYGESEYPVLNGYIGCPCRTQRTDRSMYVFPYDVGVHDLNQFKYLPKYSEKNLFYGFELEMEFPSMSNPENNMNTRIIEEIHKATKEFGVLKEDGSLRETRGVELCLFPITMDHLRDQLFGGDLGAALLKLRKLGMRSFDTGTCGMHVHVTKHKNKDAMIGRLHSLIYSGGGNFRRLMRIVSQRTSASMTQWANFSFSGSRYSPKQVALFRATVDKSVHGEDAYLDFKHSFFPNKYVALNERFNTVEFRIFKGNLSPRRIMKNAEFCEACISWCSEKPTKLSADAREFVEYIADNAMRWPELAAFMASKSMVKQEELKIVPSNR